ncbi:MAG: TRAP transporter small permease subunit [Albidovulum sp.]|nr:TRAP transporter small permease subunit [Albidovulum sp.]
MRFFALMILICAEVFARAFFLSPIPGVTDIVAYSLVGATFLQIGSAFQGVRMTRVDFLPGFLRTRSRSDLGLFGIFVSPAGVIAMVLMIQAGAPKLRRAYGESELVGIPGGFSFQVWPLRLLVVFGSAMAAAVLRVRIQGHATSLFATESMRNAVSLVILLGLLIAVWEFGFPLAMNAGGSNLQVGALAILAPVLLVSIGLHVGFVCLWLIKGRIALPYAMFGIAGNECPANNFFGA